MQAWGQGLDFCSLELKENSQWAALVHGASDTLFQVRQEASTLLHRMGDPARALEPLPPQVRTVV